jgi:very-short-patch-repair endonuclease
MTYKRCWECRAKIPETLDTPPLCDSCKKMYEEKLADLAKKKREINVELMADKAIKMLAKDAHREKNFLAYKQAIDSVLRAARKTPAIFDSSEEMAVAIALFQQRKHFKMQVKVGSRTVDICLPEEQMFIEIDGSRHENREYQDTIRDVEILHRAGLSWEIAHIAASDVNESPTRVYAKAFSIVNQKREYRKSHGYTVEPEIARILINKEQFKYRKRNP